MTGMQWRLRTGFSALRPFRAVPITEAGGVKRLLAGCGPWGK